MTEKKTKNTIKIIISFAVIGLFVFGLYFSGPKTNLDMMNQKWASEARIDVKTTETRPEKQLHVIFEGKERPKASWDKGIDTYTMHSKDEKMLFQIKAVTDTQVEILLRGPFKKVDGQQEELWVKYTSIKLNGEEMLPKEQVVWHNAPYTITFNARKGQGYNVEASWK